MERPLPRPVHVARSTGRAALGVALTRHHDAVSDALAVVDIALALDERAGAAAEAVAA